MERMSAFLIGLILVASIICGILLIVCSILVCKYWYKYRQDSLSQTSRKESLTKLDDKEQNNNYKYHTNITDQLATHEFVESRNVILRAISENHSLSVSTESNRRHSDNSPYRDDRMIRTMPSKSVSHSSTNKMKSKEFDFENYIRKKSFHLRPFELSYSPNQKMSHSMELMYSVKTPLFEKVDDRKSRSFDSNIIRNNSKSLTQLKVDQKPMDISGSFMSFLHHFSASKSRKYENLNKTSKDESSPQSQEIDLASSCPYQHQKHDWDTIRNESSQESKMCQSSFESSEINEAFLAVSREMHSSCDSELCFNSAAIKRKQFTRDKRSPRSVETTKPRQFYQQSCSANQSFERDYSVDERSSMIFNAFTRNDPKLDQSVIDENVRQRIRNERAHSQHSGQQRHRARVRVTDAMKSASFTDGEKSYPVNILVNSEITTPDSSNRAPSPMPLIVLTGD